MRTIREPYKLIEFTCSVRNKGLVDKYYDHLLEEFSSYECGMHKPFMEKRELTFHPGIKLVGYILLSLAGRSGDVIQIGVWKGFSLSFISNLTSSSRGVIGVDPLNISGQVQEIRYFKDKFFPKAGIIALPSAQALRKVKAISKGCKLIHIDGDNSFSGVLLDFLLYERLVIDGGWIVFQGYADERYSPGVRKAVNYMRDSGLFDDYFIHGAGIAGFSNSFVLERLSNGFRDQQDSR